MIHFLAEESFLNMYSNILLNLTPGSSNINDVIRVISNPFYEKNPQAQKAQKRIWHF